MRRGFTLVELSIVLVIIGLLIGGVLVGQSLVDNAQLKRLQSTIVNMEVINRQFYEKFRQLPGDSDLFDVRGNNGGSVGHAERRDALVHLAQAGMLPASYKDIDVGQTGYTYDVPFQIGVNTIDTGVENVGLSYSYSDWSGINPSDCADAADRRRANFFAMSELSGDITDSRSHTSHYRPQDFISRADYLALDKKMDDGNGRNGKLWAYGNSIGCTGGYNTCNSSDSEWSRIGFSNWAQAMVSADEIACGILYWYDYK